MCDIADTVDDGVAPDTKVAVILTERHRRPPTASGWSRQTSGFGGGGRERPSGPEPPPAKLWAWQAAAQDGLGQARAARVPQRSEKTETSTNECKKRVGTSYCIPVDKDQNDPDDDPKADAHVHSLGLVTGYM
jgi:hypothetical protein